ncbi:cytochrome c-type biogenesis protein [Antarcticirhabdus aurantiaca]|uniref:Cytochrome c-type biogenesis protein CcmH n=1 Tax=Antarcticirhabdus aurantiaca TaxID=2606717 RepID=A0ACD4NIV4_9HYPH|nr:cytochrome c-type biogenesis protein [Antarcticirhabdus aurantiaca]WAJ26681.1 cytochrome c-type biogenesis protein CcmH [Jeongeuplla avenae]
MSRRLRSVALGAALVLAPVTPAWLVLAATPAIAVEPGEELADPALEARARALSAGLRCLVCQNQSIDDSDAALAKDLRLLVRERLAAGDSDREVIDYLVSRYGEFVLLNPRLHWTTLALWGAPVVLLLAGGLFAVATVRRRAAEARNPALTAEEEKAVDAVLKERGL